MKDLFISTCLKAIVLKQLDPIFENEDTLTLTVGDERKQFEKTEDNVRLFEVMENCLDESLDLDAQQQAMVDIFNIDVKDKKQVHFLDMLNDYENITNDFELIYSNLNGTLERALWKLLIEGNVRQRWDSKLNLTKNRATFMTFNNCKVILAPNSKKSILPLKQSQLDKIQRKWKHFSGVSNVYPGDTIPTGQIHVLFDYADVVVSDFFVDTFLGQIDRIFIQNNVGKITIINPFKNFKARVQLRCMSNIEETVIGNYPAAIITPNNV